MTKLTPKKQRKLFMETARKLGCDEDKSRFEAQLGAIARVKIASKRKATKRRKNV